MTEPIKLRPEVQWFAEQLERELRKGDEPDSKYTDWWIGHADEVLVRWTLKSLVELEDDLAAVKMSPLVDSYRLAAIADAVKAASWLLMIAANWRAAKNVAARLVGAK